MKKLNSKFSLAPLKLLTNFENLLILVTRFKDPKAAILILKMLAEIRLPFCKIIPEAACDKLIPLPFSLQAMRGQHQRTSANHREGNSEESFSKHFQN
jgi:hypothetical protein